MSHVGWPKFCASSQSYMLQRMSEHKYMPDNGGILSQARKVSKRKKVGRKEESKHFVNIQKKEMSMVLLW